MGKANGLRLLLDAQTFDYTFHKSASEGFKIAVQHHLDQPLMSVKELDIATGFETQIAVTPVIYNTTQAALHRFTPQERGCYSEDEMTFKYLPKSLYRYSYCLKITQNVSFVLWQFSQIFVLLKIFYLVTLFGPGYQFSKTRQIDHFDIFDKLLST